MHIGQSLSLMRHKNDELVLYDIIDATLQVFRVVTHSMLTVVYRRFGFAYSIFKGQKVQEGSLVIEDGNDKCFESR